MKVKQLIVPLLLLLILVMFNRVFFNTFSKANKYFSAQNLYSNEVVQPQKLFDKTWKVIARDYYEPSLNNQDWARWKLHYQGKIKTEDDAKVAIDTMIASLNEPYTRFMNEKDFNDLTTSITSKIYGIGVNIYSNSGKIEIFNVIPATPADFAGLKQGDIIIAVDGKDTNGLNVSEVANIVRGPENSIVELTILRNGKKITKKIKRKEIKIKNVKSSVLDNHIGYIQIISFMGGTTPNEFLEALDNTKNTDSLIIDLRGNTGGLLDNAVFIANIFIQQGEIVEIIYRGGTKKSIKANPEQKPLDKPLVILVNGASASASEILSGALRDYNRAKIVGKKTFGKGLVQKVVPLPNKTGLNVTIAKYLTPNGTDINKMGIKPDIEIGNDFDFYLNDNKRDIQLETAKQLLSKGK
ncbi:MAG: S41 family peptidase [Cyanobacteria bacterium SIG31]|nr:S41 family peptidase [Cyanobacteria bacterium SIG31]